MDPLLSLKQPELSFSTEISNLATAVWAQTSIHSQAGQVWVIYGEGILKSTWACHSGGLPSKEPQKKITMETRKFYQIYADLESHGK